MSCDSRVIQGLLSCDHCVLHRTSGGVTKHSDGVTVTAPTLMWVKVRYPSHPHTITPSPSSHMLYNPLILPLNLKLST